MENYKYIARDPAGEKKEGLKQAAGLADVLAWLREQGFTPVSVHQVSENGRQTPQVPSRKRIKSADLSAFCWQVHAMVEGGIPVTAAIETIAEDVENLQLRMVLQKIVEKMHRGEALSSSISEFPRVFNRLACAMILAGETGGNLPEALRRLAAYFDSRDKLAKKVKGALAYPIFVVSFIVLIVIFIMTFIIPRFRAIFDQIGGKLPAFTRAFMGFYDIMRADIVYIVGFLLLLVIAAILTSKTKKGHYAFSKLVLMLPLAGKISSQAFISMFCRTMSTLLGAGVSVLEIFDILSTMTANDIIKNAVVRTKERIIEGSNISLSLAASGFFPGMVVKMIQVGEESGSLSNVLDRTADYYERKVDAAITTVMGLLEPIMIVTVGAIVLVVVLALYLPIFSMSNVAK
jgi:type IV pilus assembly protein PilC